MFSVFRSNVKKLFGNRPKKRTFASISYDKTRPDVVDGFKKIDEDDDSVAYRDDKGNIKVGIRDRKSVV